MVLVHTNSFDEKFTKGLYFLLFIRFQIKQVLETKNSK